MSGPVRIVYLSIPAISNALGVYASVYPENKWFLSSSSWPCEPPDLESRSRVLMRLAEKTSHRDTLEVLRNLPGIKEPDGQPA